MSTAPARTQHQIIRLAITDDHHLMRAALAGLCNTIKDLRVDIQAEHGLDLIDKLEQRQVDVALVDLNMPKMDGYATIDWLTRNRPEILTLAITFDETQEALARSIRAGARGFLLKSARPKDLYQAINSIRTTGYYHNELFKHHENEHPGGFTPYELEREKVLERLSPRHHQLIQLIADPRELTRGGLACAMNVHPSSIDHYCQQLRDHFGIHSRTGILLFAIKWGIIRLEEIRSPQVPGGGTGAEYNRAA